MDLRAGRGLAVAAGGADHQPGHADHGEAEHDHEDAHPPSMAGDHARALQQRTGISYTRSAASAAALEPATSPSIACARSSTRSAASSIPHDSRIEVGRDRGVGALDGLVGHRLRHLEQRLDAPERLGQGEQLASRSRSASRRGGGSRPSRRSRASARRSPRRRRASHSLTARAFSVWAAIRRCSVRSPRCTRKQSSGPGTAPIEFCTNFTPSCARDSRTTTAPPTASECPPRYFVVECTTASAPAPAAAGRPAWRTCCRRPRTRPPCARRSPRCRPRSATGWSASRPRSASSPRRTAAATASRSDWSTIVYSRPQRDSTLSTSR